MRYWLFAFPFLVACMAFANEGAKEGGGSSEKAPAATRVEIHDEDESGFVAGPEVELERDVKIPKPLVEEVEQIYEKALHESHSSLEVEGSVPRQNLDLKLYFNERSRVLKGGGNIVVNPPVGGGMLDLSKLVRPQRGTFFWHVQLRPRLFEGSVPVTKVFFLSRHVRKSQEEGAPIGIGCEKVADISSHFIKVLSKRPGQKLNTTYGAHLGTLLGTYYFFVIDAEAVRVATLTFKDPTARSVTCE